MKDQKVVIAEYKTKWPSVFEGIKTEILSLIREDISSVDHIGSTSIPGMDAKEVIDIQIGVSDFSKTDEIFARMKTANFVPNHSFLQDHVPFKGLDYFESGWEKRFLRRDVPHKCNLHIRVIGGKNWEFALLFRDYLRSCSEASQAYLQVKRRLASLSYNSETYTLIKDPVCDLIYMLAMQWAKETNWDKMKSTCVISN